MIVKKNRAPIEVENLLISILEKIHTIGPTSADDFETLSYIKKFHSTIFEKHESKLMYLLGLFYKTDKPKNMIECVYSILHESIKEHVGHDFTPVQAKTFLGIQSNHVYTFSAPTSTGKSYLFRKIVQNEERDVVIVLPSRALIAEYIYNIRHQVDKEVLVLQHIEDINRKNSKRRIYIVTPERGECLFEIAPQLNIGLLLFDEAQLIEDDFRGLKFDAFVHKCRLLIKNAKIIFAHPFVKNPEAQLERHIITHECGSDTFTQLNVGKIHIFRKDDAFIAFSPYSNPTLMFQVNDVIGEVLNRKGSVLIYVSKAKLYSNKLEEEFHPYIEFCDQIMDEKAIGLIEQLHNYIGDTGRGRKKSRIIEWMKRGIVLHHGSMPLKMRLLIEQFVNAGFARICFATSTLIQGINMPFDVVWIDNFMFRGSESKKILDLKNLIGRAGRTTSTINNFDFGYVIINYKSKKNYIDRIMRDTYLSSESKLYKNLNNIPEDEKDIVEGIQNDEYDISLRITETQKKRILDSSVFKDAKCILDHFFIENRIIKTDEYYKLSNSTRTQLKNSFKNLYTVHLRRDSLTLSEQKVLSTSIPIILWRIQGKSFREILSLRMGYILQNDERAKIRKKAKAGQITAEEEAILLSKLELRNSYAADELPNAQLRSRPLFKNNAKSNDFDYDLLIYDTYDYLDKVIGNSISDPICAVLQLYYNHTQDERAITMMNLIRYGTSDETEIWLLKYGFSMDDMEWLLPCIESINEECIVFNSKIDNLDDTQKESISRYI